MKIPEIFNWDQISQQKWAQSGILLGNGASIAIWQNFDYDSLFGAARDPSIPNPLTDLDINLFQQSQTTNFERVLLELLITQRITQALDIDDNGIIRERYASVRRALFQAIRSIHI